MKLYKEVDLLNSKKAIILLNVGSILLFFVVGAFFSILASFISQQQNLSGEISFPILLFALVLLFLCLVLHEAIHGLFLKCLILKEKSDLALRMVWLMLPVPVLFILGDSL